VGDTIYFVDGDSRVHALDVTTGTPRWVTEAARETPRPDDLNCVASPRLCEYGSFAVGDGLVYVLTSTARVVALDVEDGGVVWDIDIGGRYDLVRASVWLTATRVGVIASISEYPPLSPEGGVGEPLAWRAALLERATGDEVWTRDDLEGGGLHADDERVYVQVTFGGSRTFPCCTLLALELATGVTVWERQAELGWLIELTGDDGEQLLTGTGRGPDDATIISLDPVTGAEEWRVVIGDAYAMLPVAADGTFFTDGSDGSLRAYRLVAAAEQVAVMEGGSAARDYRFAGPGPVEGDLVERWAAPAPYSTSTAYQAQLLPIDDVVYQLVAGVDGAGDSLFVYSLTSGELIRSQPNPAGGRIAVAEAGLLMLLPAEDRSGSEPTLRSRLALLDHGTGAEIWSYPLVGASRDNPWSPIVDGDTVYVADVDARVYAVDVATGAERWVSAETRVTLPETDPCVSEPSGCLTSGFVVGDETVYVATSATTLLAIDQADGALLWEADLAMSYGIPRQSTVHLAAVPGGVLLTLTGRVGQPTALVEEGRVVRLDAASGSQTWSREVRGQVAFGPRLTADGERVFFGQVDANGECCSILALDLVTGETVWQSEATRIYPLGVIGGDLVALSTLNVGDGHTLYVIDPATGEERWQRRIPGPLNLPLAADGTMLVSRYHPTGAALVAYRVIPLAGASPVASPAASPVATPLAGDADGAPRTGGFEADHVVSAGQAVNLRSEPSTAAGGATVIGVVTDGTPLRATGRTAPADVPENGAWAEVELADGTVGWLREADVSPATRRGTSRRP